jgi:Flp pilus assembly protein TadG
MIHWIQSPLRILTHKLREQSGTALVVVAGGMLAFTSVVALAIDVGLLTTARNEAQRAADAAALAGAGAFIGSPGNDDLARFLAEDFAERNDVRRQTVEPMARTVVYYVTLCRICGLQRHTGSPPTLQATRPGCRKQAMGRE